MKAWCTFLTIGVGMAFGAMIMQDQEIRRLRNEQKEDRKVLGDACGSFLIGVQRFKEHELEQDKVNGLLIKHNDLLIHNVVKGKLERPNAGKIKAPVFEEKEP